MKFYKFFLLFLLFLAGEIFAHQTSYPEFKDYGTLGGDFSLQSTLGKKIRLSDYKASLVLIYFAFTPLKYLVYISDKQKLRGRSKCKSHTALLKRFMHIQDTGGAIRTFGRADVFWGRGELAQKTAGYMQHLGDLFILIAKKKYLVVP